MSENCCEITLEVAQQGIELEADQIEIIVSPLGETGEQGPPGVDGDKFFNFAQNTPASTWTVVHNLNKYPSVTVVDSAGTPAVGTVTYDTLNQLTIDFDGSVFSGRAYLN